MAKTVAIAIDIGNSTCVVAAVLHDRVDVIPNADGNRVTPTVVSFTENEILIGNIALSQAARNSSNTVFNIMKFVGRKFSDPGVQAMVPDSPVKVVDENGVPGFEVTFKEQLETFSAIEVLTLFIEKIKENADSFIGSSVKHAVISVPSFFNSLQRQAVSDAAVAAGLNVQEILSESIASAIAYENDRNSPVANILVYNIGGTSVEATILTPNDVKYDIKKSSFDANLGGDNFDEQLVDFLAKKFKQKEQIDIPENSEAIWKLRRIAKTKKHNFTNSFKENVAEDCLYKGKDLVCPITRVRFEGMCTDIFKSALDHVTTVLSLLNLTAKDIGEVILAGGASAMPKIVDGLQGRFEGMPLKNSIKGDEVASCGAAILADRLLRSQLDTCINFLDVSGASGGPSSKRDRLPIKVTKRSESTKNCAIGIDLGTTNSCVGVVLNGSVHIIADSQGGSRLTPSVVAFNDSEILVGEAAKLQAVENSANTIFEAKRIIGRAFNESAVQDKMKHWPFTVMNDGGQPKFQVTYKGQMKKLSPEEISAQVLVEMKRIAEDYLGHDVKDAVITVPAYFNDSQRQATIDASTIAGLNVLEIINEPTAAAIAYGIDKKIQEKCNVLVYDLGGGTFDVVLLSIKNGTFDVKAVSGDSALGGSDFDNLLLDHMAKEFQRKKGIDISQNKKAMSQLRLKCEEAKRHLSFKATEKIKIENLAPGVDFEGAISRARFEDLCSNLFEGSLDPIETVLKDSGLSISDISEVVLAGGSTRIPKVQELLQEFFEGKELNKTVNPDEAVAYGAAIHAAVLSGDTSVQELCLSDVTPLSLGLDVEEDSFTWKIIPKNTKVPVSITNSFFTMYDNQPNAYITVYEGERHLSSQNHLLGQFTLDGIRKAPKYTTQIDVTYAVDKNGILTVTAVDPSSGSKNNLTITSHKGRLGKLDLDRMIREAKDYNECNTEESNRRKVFNDLEVLCVEYQGKVGAARSKISVKSFNAVNEACQDIENWLQDNPEASISDCELRTKRLRSVFAANVP